MSLPVLDTDLNRTSERLPLSEYFNPRINPNFLPNSTIDHTLSVYKLVSIAKALLIDRGAFDVMKQIILRNTSNTSEYTCLNLFSIIYDRILPENMKYLAFFTNIAPNYAADENGHLTFLVRYFIPGSTQREYTRAQVITSIRLTPSPLGDFYEPSEEQIAEYIANTADTFNDIREKFAANAYQVFYLSSDYIPGIPKLVYYYAKGFPCFSPSSSRDTFPVAYDWASPATVLRYINEDYRISINLHPNGNRLHYDVRHAAGDRRAIERVLNYSANVLDFIPYTIKGPKEPQAVLYGIELEANSDYEAKTLAQAQKDLFFILKQDSSIWGSKRNSYELVTIPCSLKAHKRLWAEFFEKIDYTKFDTTKETGNGMHVHIGRSRFTDKHLNRFIWFITNPANENFILSVSERPTKRDLDSWASRPAYGQPSKILASRQARRTNGSMRGAVHLKADKTVEVRLFKGIVSFATIIKNLEFVDSVFEYTRLTMLSGMSLRHYISWLNHTPRNKYQTLKAFLSEIKLDDILASSDVIEHCWKLDKDQAVAEKLNKAPFKVSNAHVTFLNKRKRKRTFILKNGIVHCIAPNGGLLAKLDKNLQQKMIRGSATFARTEFAS